MSLTQVNKAGLDEIALDHVFTVGASGTDHYTFQGEGLNGTVNDPTLYLTRGKTYRFEKGSAHPLRIQSTAGASGTAYNTGVTNNGGTGTVIIEVQHDAPDILYYQCTSHANMNGILYITGALADGGVTTAKIANNAVTNAQLGDSAVTSAKIAAENVATVNLANNAVTTAKIANGAVTVNELANGSVTTSKLSGTAVGAGNIQPNAVETAKIQDDAVTSAKIADNTIVSGNLADSAITTAKIAAGAVTGTKIAAEIDNSHITSVANIAGSKLADNSISLAKLEHGTSSNNGKFLRANNGADPTFETVNTDLVSDTSPQLGGDLQSNGNNIYIADNDVLVCGSGTDLKIYHDGSDSFVKDAGVGGLRIDSNQTVLRNAAGTEHIIETAENGSVDLFYNGSKKLETTSYGTKLTGYQSSTSFVGFHVRGGLSNYGFGTNHGSGITNYDLAYMSPIPMFSNRAVQSGSNYLSFPSYAGGNYFKFTAPVAGLYHFELIASVETHHGGDWCAFGFEKNITSTYSSGELQSNFEGAIAIYERAGGDEGMGSHFACVRHLDTNDYVVLYQQSAEAIRFKNNVYCVRGHLIH